MIVDSFAAGEMTAKLVQPSGATQVSYTGAIQAIVDQVLVNIPDVVAKYKARAVSVKGCLVGQVRKESKVRANPQTGERAGGSGTKSRCVRALV